MADIFISHIHEEEVVAKALLCLLRKLLGSNRKAFLSSDRWQIHAGEIWLDRIKEELTSAKVVILLLSPESVKRAWVNFEAGAAWGMDKIIIPVCFNGLSKGNMPHPYSSRQGLDLEHDGYYLVTSLHHHLTPNGGSSSAPLPLLVGDETWKNLKEALRQLAASPGRTDRPSLSTGG